MYIYIYVNICKYLSTYIYILLEFFQRSYAIYARIVVRPASGVRAKLAASELQSYGALLKPTVKVTESC